MLSIGAFLVIVVVAMLLGALTPIGWWLVPPLIIALCGCWILVLGGLQASNPQKYERSAFSLFGWGALLIAIGGAWFVYGYGLGWVYALVIVLLALAALALATAFRKK